MATSAEQFNLSIKENAIKTYRHERRHLQQGSSAGDDDPVRSEFTELRQSRGGHHGDASCKWRQQSMEGTRDAWPLETTQLDFGSNDQQS